MKYEIGDTVRVRPLDWFETNCKINHIGYYSGNSDGAYFIGPMYKFCGNEVTITGKIFDGKFYEIANSPYSWNDYMFEDTEEKISTYEYW